MDYCNTTEYIIRPTEACKIIRNCSGCGKKERFVSTGNFRVNANGSRIDVWLIYQCEKCKHTYNLTVYERTKPGKIPKQLYLDFLANDDKTALKYGTDKELFAGNRAEVDMESLDYTIEMLKEENGEEAREKLKGRNVQAFLRKRDGVYNKLIIYNPYGLPIKADKVLSEILEISRTQVKKLMKEEMIVPVSYSGV
ncbi:MAG: DUF1062 domain-containing protein [Lachnospiraceae bacterium]|nr:DUF1062 domain-containing protein [Lachnospiraceae bacterium]